MTKTWWEYFGFYVFYIRVNQTQPLPEVTFYASCSTRYV